MKRIDVISALTDISATREREITWSLVWDMAMLSRRSTYSFSVFSFAPPYSPRIRYDSIISIVNVGDSTYTVSLVRCDEYHERERKTILVFQDSYKTIEFSRSNFKTREIHKET